MLCLAGGGAYYFAKRSINADRAERAELEEKRRQQRERLRATETLSRESALGGSKSRASARLPSKPAPNANNTSESGDPAPVAHAADGGVVGEETGEGGGGGVPKGKFEASEPFRSRKGDRFS